MRYYPSSPLVEYRDSQSGATVLGKDVRRVREHFQKSVKEYPAARVILALNNQDGFTIQQSTGREKAVSSTSELAGGGAYEHLREMANEDPILLQNLICKAQSILKGAERGEVLANAKPKSLLSPEIVLIVVNSG